jgi:hypothetical protein
VHIARQKYQKILLFLASMSQNTASYHQLLNLAKQGDTESLTALINQNLFPLGVTVMTAIQDECLVVKALLPQSIDRLFLINFMREGMERLQARSIQQVILIGQDRERIIPDWQYILNLHHVALPPVSQIHQQYIPSPLPSVTTTVRPAPRSTHLLANRSVQLLLFLATVGLLVGGTFAAKTVFLIENQLAPITDQQTLP